MKNTISKEEAWERFKGNASVKRALMVAWAGKHSIVVVGNPDNGKLYLDKIASDLGIDYSFLNPCLCGNLYDSVNTCHCSQKALKSLRNRRSFRQALNSDMVIMLERPREKDLEAREVLLEIDMQWAKPKGELALTQELPVTPGAKYLLCLAYTSQYQTLGAYERTLRVAKTIALMCGASEIEACYAAEAIQYQSNCLTVTNGDYS